MLQTGPNETPFFNNIYCRSDVFTEQPIQLHIELQPPQQQRSAWIDLAIALSPVVIPLLIEAISESWN
jgi:hypothetical protein